MTIICPTITAENLHTYREQIERVQGFAQHLHIDLMDGVFAPSTSIKPSQIWLPEHITCDIHVMCDNPLDTVKQLPDISIRTIIVQIERMKDVDVTALRTVVGDKGANLGVALLADTPVSAISSIIQLLDHVLVFSGNLGYQGGSTADLALLSKVSEILQLKPDIEIGWDGGLNDDNLARIVRAGVSVLNVGGFIHFANSPEHAYKKLVSQI